MTKSDVSLVASLEKRIFKDAWSDEQFLSETDGENYKFPIILEINSKISGYACVWAFEDEVHIRNFAIAPFFRQKGLGMKLIRFILHTFKEHKNIFLEVRESNLAAIKLYKKAGFKLFIKRQNYYSDGEDALVMQNTL